MIKVSLDGITIGNDSALTPQEEDAFALISDILKRSNLDPNIIEFDRSTTELLLVINCFNFMRMKLSGRKFWLKFCVSLRSFPELKNNPKLDNGKYVYAAKIPINSIEEIEDYADFVSASYKYMLDSSLNYPNCQ